MSAQAHPAATNDRELVLTRLIDASPEALYRCWTDPELMKLSVVRTFGADPSLD